MSECPYCHVDPFREFHTTNCPTNNYLVEKFDRDRLDAERYRKLKAFQHEGGGRYTWERLYYPGYFDAAVDALPNPAPAEQITRIDK